MSSVPISAVVLTYNEEKNIEECLKSLSGWADEIFVVDSFSKDDTKKIASKFTNKIVEHEFKNYGSQRNWALDNLPLANDWVINIDADERVTKELQDEIMSVFSKPQTHVDGFLISRRTIFMGKWIKHGGHYPAYHLRLFLRSKGRAEERLYDQHFYIENGVVETLKSDIIDTITPDFSQWLSRHKRWAYLEALEVTQSRSKNIKAQKNGNPIERKRWLRDSYYKWPLFLRAFMYYFYRYFIRLGFLDGREGFVFHLMQGLWFRTLVDSNILCIRLKKGW